MGANYFSDEQVKELEKNPYVKKVSVKSITYQKNLKNSSGQIYRKECYLEIFLKNIGFDPSLLGPRRTKSFTYRVRKEATRVEGFKDTRRTDSGRPLARVLTIEEELERLKQKCEFSSRRMIF